MAKLTKVQQENFASLKAAIEDSAEGYIFANNESLNPFVAAGLVDVNEELKDGQGNVAVRLKAAVAEAPKEAEAAAPKAPRAIASNFALDDGIPVPAQRAQNAMYPFDDMQVGQSFFVPDTEDKPNAASSLGSTVSSATARTKDANGVPTKKFVVRKVDETAQGRGPGARVWRTK